MALLKVLNEAKKDKVSIGLCRRLYKDVDIATECGDGAVLKFKPEKKPN